MMSRDINRVLTIVVMSALATAAAFAVQRLLRERRQAAIVADERLLASALPAGEVDGQPEPLELPAPEWPQGELPADPESVAVVQLLVDTAGTVAAVRLVRSLKNPDLDRAVVRAVRKARFTRPTNQGRPVPVLMYISYRFGSGAASAPEPDSP